MINKKAKIWDMLQNFEAQYTGLIDATNYINSINSEYKPKEIKKVFNKYMQYCINNNLI